MVEEERNSEAWELVGERLSLDFANTVDWLGGDDAGERLEAYKKLVGWSVVTGALTSEEAESVAQRATDDAPGVAAVLQRALTLRQALQQVMEATIEKEAPRPEALQLINEELIRAVPHLKLVPDEAGFHWHWEEASGALDAMLWPVVHDAADLLTESESLERVKQCDGHTCDWLFLDTSRNRSRRWCSMESCGNRAKARRYYRRQQKGGGGKS